jgi:maltose-binding protein MalE
MKALLATVSAIVIAVAALVSVGPPTAAGATAIDARKAKLTIWHPYVAGSAEEAAFNTVLASVRPRFPNVTFTTVWQPFGQLYPRFEADPRHGPDLFVTSNDGMAVEAHDGLLLNVTAVMKSRAAKLSPVARAGAQIANKYYMIPESTKAVALYVRDSIVPAPPATTEALLAAVEGGLKLGFVADGYFPAGFDTGFGGRIVDSSYLCIADRTPGVANAYDYLRRLVLAGASAYTQGDYYKVQADFSAGRLDAIIDGNWAGGDYRKVLGSDLSAVVLPSGPDGRSRPFVSVDGWFINAKRPNTSLATKVALAMSDPAGQATMMASGIHVPANTAVVVTDPLVADFAKAVANGKPRPVSIAFNAYWTPFATAVARVAIDGADAPSSVRTACSAMNATNGR